MKLDLNMGEKIESLGKVRGHMPQIKSKYMKEFFEFLEENGGTIKDEYVPAKYLKPSQRNFNRSKVIGMMAHFDKIKIKHGIVVSKDGYILDGHHRWLTFLNLNIPIKIQRVNIPAKALIDLAHSFDKSHKENIDEETHNV